jgi:hypothetical protein
MASRTTDNVRDVVTGAVAALRHALGADGPRDVGEDRWHSVTVNRSPQDVDPDSLPGPLAALGEDVELRIRPAPADKGTEIHARLRSGDTPEARGKLRAALRESRSLLEIGEVIEPNVNRTTQPTPLNRPLAAQTGDRGREGGLL